MQPQNPATQKGVTGYQVAVILQDIRSHPESHSFLPQHRRDQQMTCSHASEFPGLATMPLGATCRTIAPVRYSACSLCLRSMHSCVVRQTVTTAAMRWRHQLLLLLLLYSIAKMVLNTWRTRSPLSMSAMGSFLKR